MIGNLVNLFWFLAIFIVGLAIGWGVAYAIYQEKLSAVRAAQQRVTPPSSSTPS